MKMNAPTKLIAVGTTISLVVISLVAVWGTSFANSSTQFGGDPTLLWNSNGQCWSPTWQNLQASLNCGGVTYFPGTVILTDQTITMPSDSAIVGVQGFSILKASPNLKTHLLENANQAAGNSHLRIQGLTLDGSDPSHTNIQYGVLWTKVTDSVMDSVSVKDTGRDGIRFVTCQYCTATHITIENTGHHSVMFCYGTKFSEMSHVLVKRTEYEPFIIEHPNPQTGELCHDITMADCVCQSTTQFGCYIGDCYNVAATNVIVNGSGGEGFEITDCHDVTVTNCLTSNNHLGPGFEITDTASRVVVCDCIVKRPNAGTTAGFSLLGQNIRLTNCMSVDTAQPIVFSQATSDNISILSCTFTNFSKSLEIQGETIKFEDNTWLHQTASMATIVSIETAKRVLMKDNDFRDTHPLLTVINDETESATIVDNLGFATDVYRINAVIPIGLNNIYGAATSCKSAEQRLENPMIRLIWSGSLSTGEQVTVKIEAVYSNGFSRSIEKVCTTAPCTLYLDTEDWFNLAPPDSISSSMSLYKVNVYAKTSKSATQATCTVSCFNLG